MILHLHFDNYALWLLLCLVRARGAKKSLMIACTAGENFLCLLIAKNFHIFLKENAFR